MFAQDTDPTVSRLSSIPTETPLSIGMFTYSTRPRGSVVCAAALAEGLAELGHDVILYALDKGEGGFYRPLRCELCLVPTGPAPSDPERLIAQRIAEVRDFVVETQPCHDVFHAQDCLVASGLLAARSFDDSFADYHGGNEDSGLCRNIVRTVHHVEAFSDDFLETCQRRSILEADALISVSQATQRSVHEHYGRKSRVVHNGVDVARFRRDEDDAWSRLAERLGLDSSPFILSVGGLEPRKNVVNQLEAFLALRHCHPGLRWVIAGGSSIWSHRRTAKAFMEKLELSHEADAVVLAGVVLDDELTALYQHALAYLHAASHEGWGLSVMEALAARLPTVVSFGPPFNEYLDDDCAVFVDPNEPSSITAGLTSALRRADVLREQGFLRVQRFDWRLTAQAHVRTYDHLVTSTTASA